MNYGFVKIACATPNTVVGDCGHNALEICKIIEEVSKKGSQIVVFPELSITGSTCGDLFWQKKLLNKAKEKLITIADYTEDLELVVVVGLPIERKGKLYNVAAVIYNGEILGMVPKKYNEDKLLSVGYRKLRPWLEKLHSQEVIISDIDGMLVYKEKSICFHAKIYAREQIGINIPVEEVTENEFE